MSDEALTEAINVRFQQIDRRLGEGFGAVSEQVVEQGACAEFAHQRLDKALQTVSAGITRLERKLDRILALTVESRVRRP